MDGLGHAKGSESKDPRRSGEVMALLGEALRAQ